jgi:ABC-type polysaccharide/polyol phosphate transport system ATPase subunit
MDAPALPDGLALRARGLGKTYRIHRGWVPGISLKDDLVRMLSLRWLREPGARDFEALAGIDLDIAPGEVVALLGGNGAGKSTLLKLLCRITAPSAGWIAYRGRVAAVLEVGTGFHPDLSGRENIYLNGAILGMERDEINARFADIVAFAEIGEFLDEPVKRYSSGMHVRLAFAIAAHLDPDILVIDEVLAVGDEAFRAKCLRHVRERFAGRAVILVSHDMAAVASICTRGVVFDHGRLAFDGPVAEAIARYRAGLCASPS